MSRCRKSGNQLIFFIIILHEIFGIKIFPEKLIICLPDRTCVKHSTSFYRREVHQVAGREVLKQLNQRGYWLAHSPISPEGRTPGQQAKRSKRPNPKSLWRKCGSTPRSWSPLPFSAELSGSPPPAQCLTWHELIFDIF